MNGNRGKKKEKDRSEQKKEKKWNVDMKEVITKKKKPPKGV